MCCFQISIQDFSNFVTMTSSLLALFSCKKHQVSLCYLFPSLFFFQIQNFADASHITDTKWNWMKLDFSAIDPNLMGSYREVPLTLLFWNSKDMLQCFSSNLSEKKACLALKTSPARFCSTKGIYHESTINIFHPLHGKVKYSPDCEAWRWALWGNAAYQRN